MMPKQQATLNCLQTEMIFKKLLNIIITCELTFFFKLLIKKANSQYEND